MKYLLPTFITLYIFSLLGELGAFWWFFDLFSHWRVIYIVAGVVLLIAALVTHKIKWAFIAGTVLLAHTIVVMAFVQVRPLQPSVRAVSHEMNSNSQSSGLTIVFANTYWKNKDMEKVVDAVTQMNADVVFMEEIQPEQFATVSAALPEYTYALHAPVEMAFDMGVLSKVPVLSQQVHYFMPQVPLIELVVEQNGKKLHLFGVHPHSPVGAEFTKNRNEYLQKLFAYVDASQDSIVMGGDYNISQFSPTYRALLQDSRMVDTQAQFKLTSTWPTDFPTWAAIPIDQVFVTPDVQVLERYRGVDTGSDHWPIVVKVTL